MTTEHWAEYYHPGSLFDEESAKQLGRREISEAIAKMPKSAHSFILFDVEVRSGELEDGEQITDRRRVNVSMRYYPGGELFDLDRITQEIGKSSALYFNIKQHDPPIAVKTRIGNFQPFQNAELLP